MKLLTIYLIIVNALSYLLMLIDKQKAKKKLWRIPESSFFLIALLGGSLGAIAGMYSFRHKTRHLKFQIGMPILFIENVLLVYIFLQLI